MRAGLLRVCPRTLPGRMLAMAALLVSQVVIATSQGTSPSSDEPTSSVGPPVLADSELRPITFVGPRPVSVFRNVTAPVDGASLAVFARDCCIRDDVVEIYVDGNLLASVDSRGGSNGTHAGETHEVLLEEGGSHSVEYRLVLSGSSGNSGWEVSETLTPISDGFDDGDLVRGESDRSMYVIYGNAKFLIPDSASLAFMQFDAEEVETIDDDTLAALSTVPDDGTALQEFSSSVAYVINGGHKNLIPDLQTLTAMGFDKDDVGIVPDGALDVFPLQSGAAPDVLAFGVVPIPKPVSKYCRGYSDPLRFVSNVKGSPGATGNLTVWNRRSPCRKIRGRVVRAQTYAGFLEERRNEGDGDYTFNIDPERSLGRDPHWIFKLNAYYEGTPYRPGGGDDNYCIDHPFAVAAADESSPDLLEHVDKTCCAPKEWKGDPARNALIDDRCELHIEMITADQPRCHCPGPGCTEFGCARPAVHRFRSITRSVVGEAGHRAGRTVEVIGALVTDDKHILRGDCSPLLPPPTISPVTCHKLYKHGWPEIHPLWKIRFPHDRTRASAAALYPNDVPDEFECKTRCCDRLLSSKVTSASEDGCLDHAFETCGSSNTCPDVKRVSFNRKLSFRQENR